MKQFKAHGFVHLPALQHWARHFCHHGSASTEWQYQRVCSYKGFEWAEDHTLVEHGTQNCHISVDDEVLCCSASSNGAIPQPINTPKDQRVETMGFSPCSRRNSGSKFSTGLVFLGAGCYFLVRYAACPGQGRAGASIHQALI